MSNQERKISSNLMLWAYLMHLLSNELTHEYGSCGSTLIATGKQRDADDWDVDGDDCSSIACFSRSRCFFFWLFAMQQHTTITAETIMRNAAEQVTAIAINGNECDLFPFVLKLSPWSSLGVRVGETVQLGGWGLITVKLTLSAQFERPLVFSTRSSRWLATTLRNMV